MERITAKRGATGFKWGGGVGPHEGHGMQTNVARQHKIEQTEVVYYNLLVLIMQE